MMKIDPRTKIILILITVIFSIIVPTGIATCIWIAMITVLGIALGRIKKTIRAAIFFVALWLVGVFVLPVLQGTAHTSIMVWLGLMFKCYPSCMIAGVVIGTTQIGEFMAAMSKWRVPSTLVIPLAIMFRYFPTLKEDWGHICDAMILRGISLSPLCFIRNPLVVIDAMYLPILVTASKTADELAASAITRGIENPSIRTSRLDIRFTLADIVVLVIFGLTLTALIAWEAGGCA
ncbi:MAG: energy-coupling factor transporter transmembrane protein EcfT [Pseudobutyrivibrio sp.]|nr:energy-coupling factor transporter transmembrane protein EcfT [Pseudobutyrivibrio sp.]